MKIRLTTRLKHHLQAIWAMLALSLLVIHANAQAQDRGKLLRIETARPGSSIPLFVQAKEGANATVLLMPGGKGVIGAMGTDGRPSGTNFLIRSGEHFLSAGFNVAMMAKPTDLSGIDGPFRVSAEHMDDMRRSIRYLKQRFDVPVWIIGTSWGSTSAAAAAHALRDEGLIAGIALTSTMTSYRIAQAVPRLELDKINVPTLVLHHEQDACQYCRPDEVSAILKGLKNAPIKKLIMVNGGGNPTGDPCLEFHYHGYIGMEKEAIETIAAWIKNPVN
jgi:hypothetical protein